MQPFKITYEIRFDDGRAKEYSININPDTMSYILPDDAAKPDWTKLDTNKCSNCPLNSAQTPYCPVALNISHLVEDFKDHYSESMNITRVTTPERVYEKTLDMQKTVFSIFGLIMATSDCPHTKFLRPMARFHLPFATSEETLVRSISMYLLKQYFVAKEGGKPDIDLKGLEEKYASLQQVNTGILERIKKIVVADADSNAITILHNIGLNLGLAINTNLSKLKHYFD